MSDRPGELTEDAPFAGHENGYTRSKRQAEGVFLESGLDAVIVRPSIVLSRGIRDRSFARNILWVIPAIIEVGEAAVNRRAHLDIVSVQYVAEALRRLIDKPSLSCRCYNISAGRRASVTIEDFHRSISESNPKAKKVKFIGSDQKAPKRPLKKAAHRRLAAAIAYYLPFMNADVMYSNACLLNELGDWTPDCPPATLYIHELMTQIIDAEAMAEARNP
jgi:nucleoside-diphosphate-sugar epimerase